MTAWHAIEWLLVAVIIGAATWQVVRHARRARTSRGAACAGCKNGSDCQADRGTLDAQRRVVAARYR